MARTLIALTLCCIVTASAVADDKANARAKAELALILELQKTAAPAAEVRQARTPEQTAKAALAEALGQPCDCGMCDKAKPMPTAPIEKAVKVERMTYKELAAEVDKLKANEWLKVYVGQDPPKTATGRVVRLTDTIPGEEQIVGVWRCWMLDGKPTMQPWHPSSVAKRIVKDGRYYDQHADGTLFWCVECNRGR